MINHVGKRQNRGGFNLQKTVAFTVRIFQIQPPHEPRHEIIVLVGNAGKPIEHLPQNFKREPLGRGCYSVNMTHGLLVENKIRFVHHFILRERHKKRVHAGNLGTENTNQGIQLFDLHQTAFQPA